MTDEAIARISERIRVLSPETSISAEVIKNAAATHGNDSTARSIDRQTDELVEIADLLSRMESRGGKHGE